MKKLLVVAVAVTMVLMAASAFAAISGSPHDLSLSTGASNTVHDTAGTLSSCGFCHTPHNAATVSGAPLWNRSLNGDGVYTLYASSMSTTLTTAISTHKLGANSKTCLSCHDGTIGVGNVLNGSATVGVSADSDASGKLTKASVVVGPDLTNDHPVGFTVDLVGSQAGIPDFATMKTAGAKFYNEAGGTGDMECATCHDPHDNATNGKFLRLSLGSICSDCHANK